MSDDEKFSLLINDLGWLAYGGDESLYDCLKKFLEAVNNEGMYDCNQLTIAVGASSAWMLIYLFVAAHWINYGSSPRFAWLEGDGLWLKKYCSTRTSEQLAAIHSLEADKF